MDATDQSPSHRECDTSKFQNSDTTITFEARISQELCSNQVNDQFNDKEWRTIRDIVTETANTIVSFTKTRYQDWLDENNIEINNLFEAKKKMLNCLMNKTEVLD